VVAPKEEELLEVGSRGLLIDVCIRVGLRGVSGNGEVWWLPMIPFAILFFGGWIG
jgi:hypothetical protein